MTPSKPLQALFTKIISSYSDATALTLNFRSPDYSADTGGYRPVEIRLEKRAGSWGMAYVTEFTYLGGELVKDLDFDFNAGLASSSGVENGRWPPPWTSTGSGRGTFSTITGWRSTA